MIKELIMNPFLITLFAAFLWQTTAAQHPSTDVLEKVALLHRSVFIKKNADSLRLLLSKDLIYGHTDGHLESRDSLLARIRPNKGATYSEFEAQTLELYFPNRKTAIVRQAVRAKMNINGQDSHLRINLLMVWIRKHGRWLLELRQAVKTI